MNVDKAVRRAVPESIQEEFRRILWESLSDDDLLSCVDVQRRSVIQRLRFAEQGQGGTTLDILIAHFAAAIEKDIILRNALDCSLTGLPC